LITGDHYTTYTHGEFGAYNDGREDGKYKENYFYKMKLEGSRRQKKG